MLPQAVLAMFSGEVLFDGMAQTPCNPTPPEMTNPTPVTELDLGLLRTITASATSPGNLPTFRFKVSDSAPKVGAIERLNACTAGKRWVPIQLIACVAADMHHRLQLHLLIVIGLDTRF